MHARILRRGLWAGAAVALGFAGCNDSTSPAKYVPNKANGQYIVEHVSDCGGCHSQTDDMGRPIQGLEYAGGVRFDVPPFGAVYTRNITPDPRTGIGLWTDQEIIDAFRTGKAPDFTRAPGKLFPIMPYWLFGHMSDNDAHDVVAFLRSLPAVHNVVKDDSIPESARITWPLQEGIPDATPAGDQTRRGKYLVSLGGCIECHTPLNAERAHPELPGVDLSIFLAGGREFDLGPLGIVHTKNITPDAATGIGSWTPVQIDSALAFGYDEKRTPLCPPMPWPAYQGMAKSDRDAIIAYLRGIPPINHSVPEDSTNCPPH